MPHRPHLKKQCTCPSNQWTRCGHAWGASVELIPQLTELSIEMDLIFTKCCRHEQGGFTATRSKSSIKSARELYFPTWTYLIQHERLHRRSMGLCSRSWPPLGSL